MNTMIPGSTRSEGLAHSLSRFVDEAERFLEAGTHTGDQKLDTARDRFANSVSRVRNHLEDWEDDARYGARRAARKASRAAREHPYTVGAVAGVVALLGVVVLSSRRW